MCLCEVLGKSYAPKSIAESSTLGVYPIFRHTHTKAFLPNFKTCKHI